MAKTNKKLRGGMKTLLEDTSLNDRMDAVRCAVSDQFNANSGPGAKYCYTTAVFDDYVIVEQGGEYWKIPYAIDAEGDVTLQADQRQEVQAVWTAVGDGIKEGQIFALLPDRVTEGDEAPAVPTGKKWAVLIIQEGMSKNRNNYRRKALQEAAPLYEGADVFMNHSDPQKYGRPVQDKAGFLKGVHGVMVPTGKEADAPGRFCLGATLVVTKTAIRQEMLDANEEGNPGFFGLSHDALTEAVACMSAAGPFYDVQRIEEVKSVDLVSNAAAGGRVLRLVASDTVAHTLQKDGNMLTKLIEAIKATKNPALLARLEAFGATPTEDQILGLYTEAMATPPAAPAAAAPAAPVAAVPVPAREAVQPAAAQAHGVTEADVLGLRQDGLVLFLENSVGGTSLPDPVKAHLRARFTESISGAVTSADLPTKDTITKAVKEQVDLFAQLAERNIVLPTGGRPRVEIIADRHQKVTEALDAFFDPKKPAVSLRNLYVEITGDTRVTGLVKEATRLSEALTSSSFDQILGDSITRRMVSEYNLLDLQNWRDVVATVVPVNDFRTQRRMRFGGYGNLPAVGQGAPYAALTSPTDEEATYAPSKRGGTEQVTLEMIANDDVGAVRRIPTRLARAAAQTLHEFVWDFLRNNTAVYDSVALANAGHSNIVTTALTSSNLSSLRLKMKQQTDMSNGKRIGLVAMRLIVPTELEELAFQLTTSDRVVPDASISTTAAAAAPNFIRKVGITPLVIPYWTDANDYWVAADPSQVPMIEIGFFGGREDPELFTQDVPNVGSLFSNDAITWKIRHIYGGGVLDFRGFAAGIVP